jgi:caffeoyl-CoA O-methyltransferase
VLAPESDDDRAIHAVNEALVADDRVDVVQLPVRDGVSLARKR